MNSGLPDYTSDLNRDSSGTGLLSGFENTTVPTSSNTGARNYKCPRCGGEFNSWETKHYKYDGDGHRTEAITRTGFGIDHCPFCGLEKMKYDKDNDETTN